MMRALATATFVCWFTSPAFGDDTPAIPIRDLPPFPDVQQDTDTVSEVGVYGATLADEETVVGAAKREQSLGTVASAVTVITSDTIRRFGYRTLAEALRSVTGIYITDDRAIERIGIRGVQVLGDANTRILILIDGTPLNEPWSQFVDGSTALPVSLDDVARIEVIRGPVSSIYGTNAFVGIINIVTLEADKAPRAYGRATVDSYGTAGANAAFNTGDINRQLRGSIGYSYRNGESVTYPDLGTSTSADGAHSLFGSLSLNYGRLFAQLRAYDRMRELPGAPFNSELGSADNVNRDRHVLGEVGYTRELSKKLTLAGRLYANAYHYEGHLAYDGPDFQTDADSYWYGGELRALADVWRSKDLDRLSLTTGINVELTHTKSTSRDATDPLVHDFNIAGVYLEGTSEATKWLAATAGGRFDRNSEFASKLSPRAALFVHKGDAYGLKLLYAQGFRNPSIFEAYYDDGFRYYPAVDPITGKSSTQPETISSYELVLYGRPLTGVKVRLSAWEWRMEHLFKHSTVDAPGNRTAQQFKNSDTLISRGAEVESSYRDVAGRVAYASLSLSFTGKSCIFGYGLLDNPTLDASTGNCEARVNAPVAVGKLGGSTQLLFKTFYLSTELSYIGARGTREAGNVDPTVTAEVPAYVGWDATWYAPDVHGFDITVGARNLLGRERVPAQSDYDRGAGASTVEVLEVPGPGREVFARVGYRF